MSQQPLYRQRLRDALRQGMAAGYQLLIRLAHHRRGWHLLGWTAASLLLLAVLLVILADYLVSDMRKYS